jgi:hypothetical protein
MVWLAALSVAACATSGPSRIVVTRAEQIRGATSAVWLVGIAANAKLGAIIQVGDAAVLCDKRSAWVADVEGRPVVVTGTLTRRELPPLPVGPQGERSADADDSLLGAERAIFAALAKRDTRTLARLVAPDFVFSAPGQPDSDRAAFLDGVAAIPGEMLGVEGEALVAHRAGDTGIVRGVQVARVRIGGKVITDPGAFVDVFMRRGGAWVLTFAVSVETGP